MGEVTAKKIIAGRPYTKVDDLAKAGVPARVIESIRSQVSVGAAPTAKSKAAEVAAASGKVAAASGKVNLNTADLAALESLPGIGPAHARRRSSRVVPTSPLTIWTTVKGLGKTRSRRLEEPGHGESRRAASCYRIGKAAAASAHGRTGFGLDQGHAQAPRGTESQSSTRPPRKSSTRCRASARSKPRRSSRVDRSRRSRTS